MVMKSRLKFHLLAVTLIVLTVSLVHRFIGDNAPTPQKTVLVSQYPITIVNATWGKNCNSRIARALESESGKRAAPRPVVPTGKETPQLALVKSGNVLEKVRALCEGKSECSFSASATTLGEIFQDCTKNLELYYYCSEVERVNKRSFSQGQLVSLKCTPRRIR